MAANLPNEPCVSSPNRQSCPCYFHNSRFCYKPHVVAQTFQNMPRGRCVCRLCQALACFQACTSTQAVRTHLCWACWALKHAWIFTAAALLTASCRRISCMRHTDCSTSAARFLRRLQHGIMMPPVNTHAQQCIRQGEGPAVDCCMLCGPTPYLHHSTVQQVLCIKCQITRTCPPPELGMLAGSGLTGDASNHHACAPRDRASKPV